MYGLVIDPDGKCLYSQEINDKINRHRQLKQIKLPKQSLLFEGDPIHIEQLLFLGGPMSH